MQFTKSQGLETLMTALPYANQIKDINFDKEIGCIYFHWRGNEFRYNLNTNEVENHEDSILRRNDFTMLMNVLLKVTVKTQSMFKSFESMNHSLS